jgi:hypothetical protein
MSESISDPSPHEIASSLTPDQREMMMTGAENWREADTLPEGLFEYDETYDSETAEESGFWSLTDLGKQVHAVVSAEDGLT